MMHMQSYVLVERTQSYRVRIKFISNHGDVLLIISELCPSVASLHMHRPQMNGRYLIPFFNCCQVYINCCQVYTPHL